MKRVYIFLLCCTPIMFSTCTKNNDNGGGGGINIFSIQDDKDLGAQVKAEIQANPAEYPVLDPQTNQAAYSYLYGIRDAILNSGQVTYANEFAWEMYIIDNDEVQNAFCTPGGYIYVYTGLIKYLDRKSSLAGVIGHEMAHADKRHSTDQLTKVYGIQTLLSIALGEDQGLLTQVAQELVFLKFSRNNEEEADEFSVKYLCPTKYVSDGAADFFQKIVEQGSATPPQFLSTHPDPGNRVEDIRSTSNGLGCASDISEEEEIQSYADFKASL